MWWIAVAAHADTCGAHGPPEPFTSDAAPVAQSSGLAASRSRPGVLFTHGDKGDGALLYAVDLEGRYVGSHLVTGASNVDWEDLAPGPCPSDGEPCLFVGDIGDNDAVRSSITVYVAREPAEGEDARRLETWEATYPDQAQDAETLLVHPCTGDLHVVTKREDASAAVYRFPAEKSGTLELVAEIALDDDRSITGGQWDADGDRLVLRTRDRLFVWDTDPLDPDTHWDQPPTAVAEVDEEQGEAVAFTSAGDLVTTSEGQPLTFQVFPCLSPAPATEECGFVPEGKCGCASSRGAGWVGLVVVILARRSRREVP